MTLTRSTEKALALASASGSRYIGTSAARPAFMSIGAAIPHTVKLV